MAVLQPKLFEFVTSDLNLIKQENSVTSLSLSVLYANSHHHLPSGDMAAKTDIKCCDSQVNWEVLTGP